MRKILFVLSAAMLAGCGQSGGDGAGNQAPANSAAAPKPKAPHCFFKDSETKGWAASRAADGNLVVKGKAYRSDPRYKAVIGKVATGPQKVIVWPTIEQNSGYAAPDNWWDVTTTIPNTSALGTVEVQCGEKVIADLKVHVKG